MQQSGGGFCERRAWGAGNSMVSQERHGKSGAPWKVRNAMESQERHGKPGTPWGARDAMGTSAEVFMSCPQEKFSSTPGCPGPAAARRSYRGVWCRNHHYNRR